MRKIIFYFKFILKAILRLVFSLLSGGDTCVVCGKQTYIYPVCNECYTTRFLCVQKILSVKRCSICGKELLSTNNTCTDCRENPVIKSLDKMLPLFSYRLWNKELMFMWKSQEVRSLSNMFAKVLDLVLKTLGEKYIVPVPPRKGKLKEQGWDQIDELCNLLEFKYGYKILRLLERRTKNQQKKLDREGRLQQIGKAYFRVSESVYQKRLKPYGSVIPAQVVLLDDVCTTGSTLESCAFILKEAGVKKITGLTLFSVD